MGCICSFLAMILTCFTAVSCYAAESTDEYVVQELTDDNARDLTASGIVVVDFYANWCGPCRRFAPIFKEFAQEVEESATAYKVNISETQEFTDANEIAYLPTTICYKDGEEMERRTGVLTREHLWEMVTAAQDQD